ncbi:hypothetical protein ACKWTF_004582 [Chironomus riparius]
MTHIKFLSIPKRINAYNFIQNFFKDLKLTQKNIEEIRLVHIEDLTNGRYHMRLSGMNCRLINKIKNAAKQTEDGKAFCITTKSASRLFTIIDRDEEKFKVEKIPKNNNSQNLVIWLKTIPEQDLNNILKHLSDNRIDFNYISRKNNNLFLHLKSLRESRLIMKLLRREKYEPRFSSTILYIEKNLKKKAEQMPKLKVVTKKRENPKEKSKAEVQQNITHVSTYPQVLQHPVQFGLMNYQHTMYNPMIRAPTMQCQIPQMFNQFQQNSNYPAVLDLNHFNIALIPKYPNLH